MSGKVSGFIWDHYPGGGYERLVMLALADDANHEGGDIYPSVERLARRCMISARSVQRYLREIEARSTGGIPWVEVVSGDKGGRGVTREYRIPMQKLAEVVPVPRRTVTDSHPLEAEKKGDSQSPISLKGASETPFEAKRVTETPQKGDRAVSPDPLTRKEKPSPPRARVVPLHPDGELIPIPEPFEPSEETRQWLASRGIREIQPALVDAFAAHHYGGRMLTQKGWQGQFRKWAVNEKRIYEPTRKAQNDARSGGNHGAHRGRARGVEIIGDLARKAFSKTPDPVA